MTHRTIAGWSWSGLAIAWVVVVTTVILVLVVSLVARVY